MDIRVPLKTVQVFQTGFMRGVQNLVYEGVVAAFKGLRGGYFQGLGHSVLWHAPIKQP